MILSHKHKFIFIKSRKTAGTSIQLALADSLGEEDSMTGTFRSKVNEELNLRRQRNAHQTAKDMIHVVGEEMWNEYYKFTWVRNPWDLAVSRFFFDREKERTEETSFPVWIEKLSKQLWRRDILAKFTHVSGEPAMDFVGRYENLTEDFNTVCQQLGLGELSLGHYKKRSVKKVHYSEFYNDAAVNIVAEKQRKAIDYFGYTFESAPQEAEAEA